MDTRRRSMPVYLAVLLGTIVLGLATRRYPSAFPALVARYAGDVLWAMMVVWVLALVRPRAPTQRLALVAFAIAVAVEISQLYRADWIDSIRATVPGALVLGQGFLWSDIVCYAGGVALAAAGDWRLHRGSAPAVAS